jgi:NAD(P)-dependent dehydrogenase (short-subunit alcohol dehydrogenase family)
VAKGSEVAVVTGGTGALGRWVVKRLVEGGRVVYVPWIAREEVEPLREFLGSAAKGVVLAEAILTNPTEVDRYFANVEAEGGRLDVLCNLAGGFRAAPITGTDPDSWDHMLRMNATSAFLCCRAAVPLMQKTGKGRIVNVGAIPALERGAAEMTAYAASKSALLGLTYSLARELRPARITVNAIAPEILDTPANRKAMPNADTSRWVRPEDAANVVAFLASDEAAAVTGSVLVLAVG